MCRLSIQHPEKEHRPQWTVTPDTPGEAYLSSKSPSLSSCVAATSREASLFPRSCSCSDVLSWSSPLVDATVCTLWSIFWTTMNNEPRSFSTFFTFLLLQFYWHIWPDYVTGIDLWIWMCYSRYWDEQIINRSKINRRLGNRNDITRNKHTHIAIKGDHISAKQWEQEVWRHINLHPDAWF